MGHMNKKAGVSLVAGIIISAAALYLSLRNVPFADLFRYLALIDYRWVLLSGAVALPCFVLRALRWRILLENKKRFGFWRVFHPLMIGFMLNSILPGRIGEAARPYILAKKENFPFITGFATIAAERLMDMIFLILLSAAVLSTLNITPDYTITFGEYQLGPETLSSIGTGLLRLCLVVTGGILVIMFPMTRSMIQRLILFFPETIPFAPRAFKRRLKENVMQTLVDLIDLFAAGFSLLKRPVKIFHCLILTLLIWGGTALTFYVMAKGCPGVDISFLQSIALMVIICLFIALPSAPGYWGLWEAGGVFGLSLFGIPAETAAGYTLVNHFIQLLPVIAIGFISAMITGVGVLQVTKAQPEKNRPPIEKDFV